MTPFQTLGDSIVKTHDIVIRENNCARKAFCTLCHGFDRMTVPFCFCLSGEGYHWVCERCAAKHCGIELVHVVNLASTAYLLLRGDVDATHIVEYLREEIGHYETERNFHEVGDEREQSEPTDSSNIEF